MHCSTRVGLIATLTLALALPTAGGAMAASQHTSAPTVHHARTKAPAKRAPVFVAAGTLTSIDAGTGALTFTVQGGRDKALRTTLVSVTLTPGARISRNGAAAGLADLHTGDHVSVQGTTTDTGYSVSRVSAEGPKTTPTPAPAPTPSSTPEPTPSA